MPTWDTCNFVSCFRTHSRTSDGRMDPLEKLRKLLMSLSLRLRALISKNPTYWSGRTTRCSVTLRIAWSHLLKKARCPSSRPRRRWYVTFANDDSKSSSWSSPKFSGKFITRRSSSPFRSLVIQLESLARYFIASKGVFDNFWSRRGPRVRGLAFVVASHKLALIW